MVVVLEDNGLMMLLVRSVDRTAPCVAHAGTLSRGSKNVERTVSCSCLGFVVSMIRHAE